MHTLPSTYVLICGILVVILFGVYEYTHTAHEASLSDLSTCFSKNSSTTTPNPECLRETIQTLLKSFATGDVLRYITSDSASPTLTQNCHAIAHIIGEKTFEETKSLEQTLARCTSDCRYGCMHGALAAAVLQEIGEEYPDEDIAHADTKTIRAIGKKYCSESSTLCHGIGHILYISSQNYADALQGCEAVAESYEREMCYQGVFMESLGSSESLLLGSTTASVPRDVEYGYPCAGMQEKYKHACFFYLPLFEKILFDRDTIQNGEERFSRARAVCDKEHEVGRSYCILGMSYFTGTGNIFSADSLKVGTLCDRFSEGTGRSACIVGIVLHFEDNAEYQRGIRYCHSLSDTRDRSLCYNVAFQAMGWVPEKSDVAGICATSENSEECTMEFARYQKSASSLPQYRFDLYPHTQNPPQ